jgi:hypothetical protein
MHCFPGKPVRFGACGLTTLLYSHNSHLVGLNRQYLFQILDPPRYYCLGTLLSFNRKELAPKSVADPVGRTLILLIR